MKINYYRCCKSIAIPDQLKSTQYFFLNVCQVRFFHIVIAAFKTLSQAFSGVCIVNIVITKTQGINYLYYKVVLCHGKESETDA